MSRCPIRHGAETRKVTILKGIEQYPHSFQLKDISVNQLKTKPFQNLRNHLEEELKAGYKTSLQTASARNLLAFALFQLGDHDEALEETEKVLKMDDQQNNIVSLANKVHMHTKMTSFADAQEAVDELKELQETPEIDYLLVKAKAELAASYLRFGPRFNKYAIDTFKEVLPQAKEPEVWMWKFGLAMAYRRALDLQHAPYVSLEQYTVTHRDALKLLQEITDSKPTAGEAHVNLQANAYAEMGILLRLTWDKTTEYRLCSQVQAGPLACCKKALELDENDASVLWKSGKVFRGFRDIPEAKRLLEKAVQQQRSSAAYHHLGLTYKAMATNLQYGRNEKKRTRRGGKREKRRKQAMANKAKRFKSDGCPAHEESNKDHRVYASSSQTQQNRTVERMKKIVKSPNTFTQFDPQKENVQMAIKYLETAVEFSAGENSRAAYDLALMQAGTGKLDEAVQTFKGIAQRQTSDLGTPSGLLECVTSLEQIGLIYKQKADRELMNDKERKKLIEKSNQALYDALSLASELYSKTPMFRNIGDILRAPQALLEAADASDCSEVEKQKKKADILSLMKDHKQSLAILHDIGEETRDAKYYQLKIQAYAGNREYREAVATISCLKPTKQYEEVMKLLLQEDSIHSVFSIYLEAGREALYDRDVDVPCMVGPRYYFSTAFRGVFQPPKVDGNSDPPDDDPTGLDGTIAIDTGSSKPEDPWDIMLLHDDEDDDIEDKAVKLYNLLETACGLRVVRRDGNHLLGTRVRTVILNNIETSRLVVILPGKKERLPEFEEFVSIAATKEFAVLLTRDIGPEAIPQELKTPRLRYMECPEDLLAPGNDAADVYTKEVINGLCCLFSFLGTKE